MNTRFLIRNILLFLVCGFTFLNAGAQCPDRPAAGTVVQDALSLNSQNGVLSAGFTMATSVDNAGYTHYCYIYNTDRAWRRRPPCV